MILNNRQTAILYELIDNDTHLSYVYLCNRFLATEKTIRTDIKKINDFLKKDEIQVKLTKGKGFNLLCSHEQRKMLKINFSYRYKDSSEVISSHNKRDITLNYYLTKGNIKEETLVKELGISVKSITSILKDVRNNLKEYNLKLNSKPYKGLYIEGNEINIRNYLIDSASFMVTSNIRELFYDNVEVFKIDKKKIDTLLEIFVEGIKKYKIDITQHGLIVIIVAIVFSYQRYLNGFKVSFTSSQIEIIKSYKYYDKYLKLLSEIENISNIEYPIEEKYFAISYAIILSDFSSDVIDVSLIKHEKEYTKELISIFDEYNICDSSKLSLLKNDLKALVKNAFVRKELSFIESDYNSSLKVAMINSSVSSTIGLLLFNKLERLFDFKFGDYTLMSIIVATHNQIRYVTRTNTLCNIALFTPIHKNDARSVVDRIMYHCGKFINKVDVLNSSDLFNVNINNYDLFLYFGDYEPLGKEITIDKLKIDYYFNNDDRNALYDKLRVMTRSYKNCFGSLKKEDIIENNSDISDLYSAVVYARELCKEDPLLLKQLELIPLDGNLIYKDTFNINLFTNKDELKTTKLIKLNKAVRYNDQYISRILINIINSGNDIKNIKTIESVIRKMSEHITYNINNVEADIDLFSYYIKSSI